MCTCGGYLVVVLGSSTPAYEPPPGTVSLAGPLGHLDPVPSRLPLRRQGGVDQSLLAGQSM